MARHAEEYRRLGVEPVVVLPQKREAVERFVAETHPPFEILIDEKRDVVKTYGVWHRIGLDAWNIARPAVFLIDRDRSIRYSFIGTSQAQFPSHEEILRAI